MPKELALCIVSGGQTGVDLGALDAALELGIPTGGWCPANRSNEEGRIPTRYPLAPLPGAGCAARTQRNVEDSDGTLIIVSGAQLEGGTLLTANHARRCGKPLLIIVSTGKAASPTAPAQVEEFIRTHDIRTLNVAGPRASGWPEGQQHAKEIVRLTLELLQTRHPCTAAP